MGYTDKSRENIFIPLLVAFKPVGNGPSSVGMRTGRICHGASLAYILIFCNKLSSELAFVSSFEKTLAMWADFPERSAAARGRLA
jgi:hypothetical protein